MKTKLPNKKITQEDFEETTICYMPSIVNAPIFMAGMTSYENKMNLNGEAAIEIDKIMPESKPLEEKIYSLDVDFKLGYVLILK